MNLDLARFNMVEQQIRPWNVFDPAVLDLFLAIKREHFVLEKFKNIALSDLEIPLPGGQKMLSPCEEARLIQELHITNTDLVLEIGTGSGYVTAILAKLADFVYSIELEEENKKFAATNLAAANCCNIALHLGNGLSGMLSKAPFDKIFLGGGVLEIPLVLKEQLKIGGKLVGFVGVSPVMHAVSVVRDSTNSYIETKLFETDVEYLVTGNPQRFSF